MKNNMMKFLLVFSLLLNMSMLASAGYTYYRQSRHLAVPVGHGFQKPGEMVPACLFESLSLKPGQLKTMQEKAFAFHAGLDKKRQEIDLKRGTLVELMRADRPDPKSIEAAIAEINELQQDVQKIAVAHMLEFKSLLDKEQQKKFFDLVGGAMTGKGAPQCP
jgi:Spy/CpxP family protein refolding chaperone